MAALPQSPLPIEILTQAGLPWKGPKTNWLSRLIYIPAQFELGRVCYNNALKFAELAIKITLAYIIVMHFWNIAEQSELLTVSLFF